MTISVHRLCLAVIAALSVVALSACGVENRQTPDVPPMAGHVDAGAGDAMGRGFGYQAAEGTELADGTDAGTDAGTDTGDGTVGGNDPLQADTVQPLGGRATYEGDATGLYAVGNPSLAYRYFGAHVRLTADFRDNYIWGTITDGRDTVSLEQIFERLTLEPAALDADETAYFENRVAGVVVGGNLWTGEWSGRFSGGGASSTDPAGRRRRDLLG